jgi:signal transduction histidine kinase
MDWIAWSVAAVLAAGLAAAGLRLGALSRRAARARQRADEATAALAQAREALALTERRAADDLARAREAAGHRTRFLAAASHDLRQPVHAVTLFAAALKAEPLEGRPRQLIERLDRALVGLDDLFNRLLDISRLDGGALEPHRSRFAVAGLLQPLEARFGPVAAQRGLHLRVRAVRDAYVDSDPALLVEMVMNLLSNALRYTDRGGVLLAARTRGDRVLLQVWDTGRGIPADRIDRVFEEFVQLDNPSRDRRRGLGLGLSIVRRLSESLGHPVTVRSRPGRGSVFTISVPRAGPPAAPAVTVADAGDAALRGLLVLVVDDELDVLLATEALLTAWGCHALLARTIAEATARIDASERYPDLLLTDHALGDGTTGFEVADAVLRTLPAPVPVLMLSGDADPTIERRAREAGLHWLPKPVDPQRLRATVASAVAAGRHPT